MTKPMMLAEPDSAEICTPSTVTAVWVMVGATVSMPDFTILSRNRPTSTTPAMPRTTTRMTTIRRVFLRVFIMLKVETPQVPVSLENISGRQQVTDAIRQFLELVRFLEKTIRLHRRVGKNVLIHGAADEGDFLARVDPAAFAHEVHATHAAHGVIGQHDLR